MCPHIVSCSVWDPSCPFGRTKSFFKIGYGLWVPSCTYDLSLTHTVLFQQLQKKLFSQPTPCDHYIQFASFCITDTFISPCIIDIFISVWVPISTFAVDYDIPKTHETTSWVSYIHHPSFDRVTFNVVSVLPGSDHSSFVNLIMYSLHITWVSFRIHHSRSVLSTCYWCANQDVNHVQIKRLSLLQPAVSYFVGENDNTFQNANRIETELIQNTNTINSKIQHTIQYANAM